MNEQIKKRLKRSAILCTIALVIGIGAGFLELNGQNARVINKPMAGVKIGGPYELTDQNGKTVTDQDFPGQYKLIYFGFTFCPAICPAELGKMTKALRALGPDADKIKPLFMTIDPERDTPAVLKNYLTMFDPRITGLTGPKDKMDTMLKDYKIFAAKRQQPEMDDYTMDHSSFIYLLDPQGNLLSIYRTEDNADLMVEDIGDKI